jgi:MOSC domain-containing protein YiiM
MADLRVLSIQVGRVHTFQPATPEGNPWRSAIAKEAVLGELQLGAEGLAGDMQADRRYHGGPERALLAYSADHYPNWRRELSRELLPYGMFGENLTVAGLDEETACIGDSFALGQAVVQISQPRMPCVKLARRLDTPDMVQRTLSTARTGFYLRVLEQGMVAPGPLRLVQRPFPGLTISVALRALVNPMAAGPLLDELLACPLLADGWRDEVARSRARALRHGAHVADR